MKHARHTIREQAAAMIEAAIPDYPVYVSRAYPVVTTPVISVFADQESAELENDLIGTPHRYTRRLQMVVEVAVESVLGHDNYADGIAAQVEAALEADVTLNGYATELKLESTDVTVDAGEKPLAVSRLTYEVWYRTVGTDPETAL